MRHELLAPAGSYAVCEAVITAGADAVYLGGERFSARAYAPNFSDEDIMRALDFAHLRGKKIYLALNTLLKNRETDRELYRYIKPFYEHGLDAIIVQDYGVFQFVKRYFSDLPVHISTQMSVANTYGAGFLREKGAKRIIPARELSLDEIRGIHEAVDVELECFVHGALCYCYSGQCLLSSLIGGRSGNRGRCAQPCRLPYQVQDEEGNAVGGEVSFPLSLKDLCAADFIPQLCEAGVHAFKIEGRMKSLAYAAGVTEIYRKYIDIYESDPREYAVSAKDRQILLALGNRSGFTGGYYEMRSGGAMLTRTDSSHTSGEAEEVYGQKRPAQIPVSGTATLIPGQPIRLTVRSTASGAAAAGEEIKVTGDSVQAAKSRPLSEDDVRAQITKTGETPFVFESLEVKIYGDCFIPVGKINELRRDALAGLEELLLRPARRDPAGGKPADSADDSAAGGWAKASSEKAVPLEWTAPRDGSTGPMLDVTVCTREQLEAALACPFVDMISLDLDTDNEYSVPDSACRQQGGLADVKEAFARIAAAGKRTGFFFPYVFRKNTSDIFETEGWAGTLARFDVLWVRGYDSLGWCFSHPEISRDAVRLDAGMYVFSEEARNDFFLEGIGGYTAAVELNAGELAHMDNSRAEFCVYGYTPVMVSAQCIYKNCGGPSGCGNKYEKFYLSDRYFNKFYAKRNCRDCYNVIYNSRPLFLLHRADDIKGLGFGSLRISFTQEDAETAGEILNDYRAAFLEDEPVSAPTGEHSYTNGHFRRGVE